MPQQGVTHSGEAAKQAQIELPFSGVPTVVARYCRGLQHRHQPPRCKFAKIAALEGAARLAEEFDAAQCAAAERIYGAWPASLRALKGIADIHCQELAVHSLLFDRRDARKADTGSSMAPLAWPTRRTIGPPIGPVIAL